ncbi:MAG: phosphate acetyltransferase, partial [Clostridia bacterium]|nr:phosphate acetyltransferase [Clostridia bacterium]
MKDILQDIKNRASALNKTIVLPEAEDKRVVEAAVKTVKENVAKIVLLGNKDEILANNPGVDLTGVTVIDPATYEKTGDYAKLLFDLRKGKINKKTGLDEYPTVDDAKNYILKDFTMYGALMLTLNDVDGMVS